MTPSPSVVEARGPFFDELSHGQVFDGAPAVTLTEGAAAVHQAILGDRMMLTLDHELSSRVSGRGPLAHPGHVWDVAIGQSTVATQFVRANLFYRGLVFRRFPVLGDTLRTTTTVVGLKQNSVRPNRPRTGLAVLRIRTVDQDGRPVLDFHRCAMLPLGPDAGSTKHADELDAIGGSSALRSAVLPASSSAIDRALDSLDLSPIGPRPAVPVVGTVIDVVGGDVVSGAPELARLTLNLAQVHHDSAATEGERLVYGGHTIGIAAAHVGRALPGILLFLGWRSCDHLSPVHEGDTLRSRIEVEQVRPGPQGSSVVALRSQVTADAASPAASPRQPVLDWCFTVLA